MPCVGLLAGSCLADTLDSAYSVSPANTGCVALTLSQPRFATTFALTVRTLIEHLQVFTQRVHSRHDPSRRQCCIIGASLRKNRSPGASTRAA